VHCRPTFWWHGMKIAGIAAQLIRNLSLYGKNHMLIAGMQVSFE
jgi:hypothetical protein